MECLQGFQSQVKWAGLKKPFLRLSIELRSMSDAFCVKQNAHPDGYGAKSVYGKFSGNPVA